MDSIRQAVILLSPLSSGYRILFEKDIAGLKFFLRLLLTLQRAGIEEFIILSKHLPEEERAKIDQRLRHDFRFKGNLFWVDQKTFLQKENPTSLKGLDNSLGFLLLEANQVTTTGLIEEFALHTWRAETGIKSQIAQLALADEDEENLEKIFIFPPHSAERLVKLLRYESTDESTVPIEVESKQFLLQTVEGAPDARWNITGGCPCRSPMLTPQFSINCTTKIHTYSS